MTRILPQGGRRTGRPAMLWLGLALLLAAGVVPAGTVQDAPDALTAGPVFFAPWFQTEVLADDNIFRRSELQNPVGDVATTVTAGVTMSIPIRMSNLEIGYEGNNWFYRDAEFAGTKTHTGSVVFDLNFSSFNTLHIEETYTDGFTELQTGVAEEIIVQGVPYWRNEWAVEWLREIAQRPSFRARIERSDLKYRPEELGLPIPWLDHEGWDVEYEYVQPIYRRGGLTAKYNARRQDQFEAGRGSNLTPPVPDAIPLRREEYDGLEVGYRGLIGRHQPLIVRLGYGKLAFRDVQGGDEPSDYRGLIGNITWRLPLGGLSNMAVTLSRRPLSSIYNTYYVINEVQARFAHRFKEISQWGVNLSVSSNRYGDIATETANGQPTNNCTVRHDNMLVDIIRHDRGRQIEGFWEWIIHPRMGLRMSATHNGRDSNCENSGYSSNALGMTFKVGWF